MHSQSILLDRFIPRLSMENTPSSGALWFSAPTAKEDRGVGRDWDIDAIAF